MSKGSKTTTNQATNQTQTQQATSTSQIDPVRQAQQNQLYNTALQVANTPYQPFTGQAVAPASGLQNLAYGAAPGVLGAGSDLVNQAAAGYQAAQGYTPQQVTPQQVVAPQVNAAGLAAFNPGAISAQQVQAQTGANGYQQYMNPYTSDVVNQTLQQLELQRQQATSQTEGQAAAAGAFGGSRSGVAQALTNQGYENAEANAVANLNQSGFQNAITQNAADQARQLAAAQGNQQTALGASQASLAAQTQAGLAGQQNLLSAALANQQTGLQAGLANAQYGLYAGLGNAQNSLAGQQLGLAASGGLGALGGQQQQMGINGLSTLSALGGQQQQTQQAQDTFNYQQYLNQQNLPYAQLGALASVFPSLAYGTTQNQQGTGTMQGTAIGTQQQQQSPWNTVLGAAQIGAELLL